MDKPRFGEVITAMVTPFDAHGPLDEGKVREVARHLVENGSDGLVVCGTTGESPTLSHDEKLTLFRTVVDEVGDRASVIAGTGTNNTAESIGLTREACELGVDGILAVTPYYNKPPQSGLVAHFSAIADESNRPVMLYDIPGRTGRRIERSTLVELAGHDRIVAVKDAVGDAGETSLVRADLDAAGHTDFEIYSGDDGLLLPHLAAGAVGIVSVCAHLAGRQIKQVFEAWNDGKVEEARRIYIGLVPLMAVVMGLTASPIPVKAGLGLLGIDVGSARPPMLPATDEEVGAVRAAMERAGLL